jgi:two-component system, cell cycle response regulator
MTARPDESGFAETQRLDLADLPGPRFAAPMASAAAALPARPAVAAVAPVAQPGAAPRARAPSRRATDLDPNAVARASLFRRRSTDPVRPSFGTRGAERPIATLKAVETLSHPIPAVVAVPTPAPIAEPPPALRLFVRGFKPMEQRLLEGAVRLSERRLPRLALLSEADAANADVLMIDGADGAATAWLASRPSLAGKPTIWVDSRSARPGHTTVSRPVQWPMLPMLLARALENAPAQSWADSMPAPAALTQTATTTATSPAPPALAPVARADLNHVLVVDDSLAVRNHLRSLLEARGIRVSEAACVREALAVVETERFTCALMDVLMPDMDGYEGCKRLKSMKSSIGKLPVVMLTSKSSPFDRIRGKMAGCDAYLTKPVAPEQFYATLDEYIGGGARRPPAPAKTSIAMRSA